MYVLFHHKSHLKQFHILSNKIVSFSCEGVGVAHILGHLKINFYTILYTRDLQGARSHNLHKHLN